MNEEQIDTEKQQPQTQSTQSEEQPSEGSKGALIGSVIVVVLIIAGGIYIFLNRPTPAQLPPEEITDAEDTALDNLNSQSNSDELSDIEADVNNTDLENLDAELENIEQELNEAL